MSYADRTKVTIDRTKAQIEELVMAHRADAFGIMTHGRAAQVAFRLADRNVLFRIHLPEAEQARRSRWRALLLVIKAKLESYEAGIETIEEAFLAQIVMPGGQTVADHVVPVITAHYAGETDIPLLPGPTP